MGFCGKCGERLEDSALFCPNCGSKVTEVASADKNIAEDTAGNIEGVKKDKKKSVVPMIIIIIAAVLIATILSATFLIKKTIEKGFFQTIINKDVISNELKNEVIEVDTNESIDKTTDEDIDEETDIDIDESEFSEEKGESADENSYSDNSSGFTDEELCEYSLMYVEKKTGYRPSIAEVVDDDNNYVTIHLFDIVDDHTATTDWYYINRSTLRGYDFLDNPINLFDAVDGYGKDLGEDYDYDYDYDNYSRSYEYMCSWSSEELINDYNYPNLEIFVITNFSIPEGKTVSQMIINEIYARHGYIFNNQELQNYFNDLDWYTGLNGDMNEVRKDLNQIEIKNIEYLKTVN